MTVRPAGLVIVVLLTVGTITAARRSVRLCLCTRGCCDENWYQYKDACYWPGNSRRSWDEAEGSCLAQDAHLASVHTPEEDKFIFYLMGWRGSYWLGAENIRTSGNSYWKWSDNSAWHYASEKLNSKYPRLESHVIVERWGDDDDDDKDDDGIISWDYERAHDKRHLFICKYLLV